MTRTSLSLSFALSAMLATCGAWGAAAAEGDQAVKLDLPIAAGPFQPTLDSLKQYKCPEWFRDAKFGIWAHWGPQSVPMVGDWYARNLYLQGSGQYNEHLKVYGHPSEFGYKDIIPLWKAEKWNPEELMALYKKAGAKYFVSMACHHDNFDLWNSKYHTWNSVNMGPKRDVVGDWQKAAKKEGLKFGVSEHMGASFTWFQSAHGADKEGPKAGVPYDGADPKYAELYHTPAKPGDTGWYSNNPEWHQEWFNRIKDLLDNYQPDLLYTDGGLPFGVVGQSMVANYYNASQARNGGTVEAVYTCKQGSEGRWVEDIERGVMPGINPYPWQTDTSIGDWYYNRNWKFRGADWLIQSLVDIVSKNGNLLINVVQRPDGSIDPEARKLLEETGDWMTINSEAIYGTRPWQTYGEGPAKAKGGAFKEDFGFSAKDIRFTTKGDKTVYAIALGWPEGGSITLRSLARPEDEKVNTIEDVCLLGSPDKLQWKQTADGLTITLPAKQPCNYAVTLKITGGDWKAIPVPVVVETIKADAQGNFTLPADKAELEGNLKTEDHGGKTNIGFWDNANDSAQWTVAVAGPGVYEVSGLIAAAKGDSVLAIECNGKQISAKIAKTDAWDNFQNANLGKLEVTKAGSVVIKAKAKDAASWNPVNLRELKLQK